MWYTKNMKRYMKNFFVAIIVSLAMAFVFVPKVNIVSAEAVLNNKINYVSLGDSIAEGYGLAGFVATETLKTNFNQGSYAQRFKAMLENEYGASNVSAISYAKSGESTTSLLPKLDEEEIQNAIREADVLTICIGANDILGPANEGIGDFIFYGTDISGDLADGLDVFSTNFPQILSKINALNPNCIKIFTNVYNPYKPLIEMTNDVSLSVMGFPWTISVDKLNQIGQMSEDFIAGNQTAGLYGFSDGVYGLNQRMEDFLKDEENTYLCKSKVNFDAYSGDYSEIVLATLHKQTTISVNSLDVNAIMPYIDPHPTGKGHGLLYENFSTCFENNVRTVKYNFMGGTANGSGTSTGLVALGERITPPSGSNIPTKTNSTFVGWYEDMGLTTIWNFETPITENIVLYAKWSSMYVVTFNSVGGTTIESQELLEGSKVTRPEDPRKAGSTDVFAGWYYLGGDSEKVLWDFENNTISGNITLIAMWANSICTSMDLLNQTVNNLRPITFRIDITGAYIQWYVNDNIQVGETGNTFVFTPPEQTGTYRVYCVVNGKQTKTHEVKVEPYAPQDIKIIVASVSDKNLYTFSIEGGNYLDGSKCKWYATIDPYSNECEEIGVGSTCTVRLSSNCKVFMKYGDEQMVSNSILIEPQTPVSNIAFIIAGALGAVAVFVVLIVIISKKRYNNYY